MGRVNCQHKGVFKQLIFNALDIEFFQHKKVSLIHKYFNYDWDHLTVALELACG